KSPAPRRGGKYPARSPKSPSRCDPRGDNASCRSSELEDTGLEAHVGAEIAVVVALDALLPFGAVGFAEEERLGVQDVFPERLALADLQGAPVRRLGHAGAGAGPEAGLDLRHGGRVGKIPERAPFVIAKATVIPPQPARDLPEDPVAQPAADLAV